MPSPGALVVTAVAAIASLAAPGLAGPQTTGSEDRPFLLALRGNVVTLNYTPGALDRAVHVQQRLELLGRDVARWTSAGVKLRVFVLSRAEWGKFGFLLPYGLPGRIADGTLAVPSYGDAGTVRLWSDVRGEPLAPLPGIPLKGTAEEAASLALSDLMMEVEAARVLLHLAGVRGESGWLQQVMAHLVARAAFERYEVSRMPQIDGFFASLGRGVDGALPLARYAPGLDLPSFLWFESRFYDGARTAMASRCGPRGLLKLARKNGGVLTERAAFEACPPLRGWLAETFAPSPGAAAGVESAGPGHPGR